MNVFQYAANEEAMFEALLEDNCAPYKREYTFYSDFSIAEFVSGKEGILDTYKRVVQSWLSESNKKAVVEIQYTLNYKSWEFDARAKKGQANARELCELYCELNDKFKDLVYDKFSNNKEFIDYFWDMTD